MSAADHNLSVLVVSEDSLELAGVRRRLQQRGHRVYSVTTAAAAAEACAQDAAFDVVVCDTVLPDSDGRRFGAELARSRSLPSIAIGETSDHAAVSETFAAGMMAHVAKPLSTELLPEMIELVAYYPRPHPR
jgi:CheY-like chemotaxis protein